MLVQTIVILGSIVVKNPGCHAGDLGSITRETWIQFPSGQQEMVFSAIVNCHFEGKTYCTF